MVHIHCFYSLKRTFCRVITGSKICRPYILNIWKNKIRFFYTLICIFQLVKIQKQIINAKLNTGFNSTSSAGYKIWTSETKFGSICPAKSGVSFHCRRLQSTGVVWRPSSWSRGRGDVTVPNQLSIKSSNIKVILHQGTEVPLSWSVLVGGCNWTLKRRW